ncbi:YJL207C [Saccharomyces arboricola H-6]|uniref:YJL207C n=1 Tax=Saccharomyces arboricola (strain H-6 / AS 2.3317 / CBS 10644) TaxID=1160507 RepID=J8Q0Q3_SACAR|nr:YJL207C [Saccharomyces arboricola H-6]
MANQSLKKLIETSADKGHDLLTWIVTNLEKLISLKDVSDPELQEVKEIHAQLNEFVRYTTILEDTDDLELHSVFISFSQLYTISTWRLKDEYPGVIFDSSAFLTSVLCEEDVLTNDEVNELNQKEKKKKSTIKKKRYIYTPAKDIACTILIQTFENFGSSISSLVPLLFGIILKNLRKIMEKSKYHHATFMTSLLQLFNVILRNSNNDDKILDPNTYAKFSKLSKTTFESISSDEKDFPVTFVSVLIECWTAHFKQTTFIKEHSHDILETIYSRFTEGEIGVYGFANDETRIYTAKSLAEILFDYYFSKNIITLQEVWSIYVRIFLNCASRDIESGSFESIIHFITLNLLADNTFLSNLKYLDIVLSLSEIFSCYEVNNRSMNTLSRYLRHFEHMHELILPHLCDTAKTQVLYYILGCSDSYQGSSKADLTTGPKYAIDARPETQWLTLLQLNLTCNLISDLNSTFATEEHIVKEIRDKLVELATCEIFTIRVHTMEILRVFLNNCPEYLSETIENSLRTLSTDFKSTDKFVFHKNHGHAFVIANLIKDAKSDYISYELIMRITVFSTSFIKNNTTSTSSNLYFKGLLCWILLIGLMNYKDEQYLKLQIPQLFLFWKVLLTHTYTYHDEDELYKNLEIRNHALTCLLTYLSNTEINKDVAKQVSYLLTKCSNFNHSINLKSKNIDNALLHNENRILQVYLKLEKYISGDFNSSLLILIVKNFSDPNLYTESSTSTLSGLKDTHNKKVGNKDNAENNAGSESSINTLLRQNNGFAFGLSSKVTNDHIMNLSMSSNYKFYEPISGSWPSKDYNWYNIFEKEVSKPISPILSLDSLILLYGSGSYSQLDRYAPQVTTSLIDSSMELFSSVFPFLNSKIQYSVMETLNLSMFSKMTTPLRSVAIAANVCGALHSALRIMQEKNLELDYSVGKLIIESIKKLQFFNDTFLTKIKADCIGLLTAAIARTFDSEERQKFLTEQSRIFIKNVADMDEPYLRMFHVLSLATIFKYNSQYASFETSFDVIFALTKDPHPVVHSWSLKAMHVLLEKHSVIDLKTAAVLLNFMEEILVSDKYGVYGRSVLRCNYNMEFNSHVAIGEISRTLTETVGPNFLELNPKVLDSFRNITFSLLISNNIFNSITSIKIFENIATFKMKTILNHKIFISFSKNIIKGSLVAGIGSSYFDATFTGSNELISRTSSLKSAFENFDLFTLLYKLQMEDIFMKEMENLSWRYLALFPTSRSVSNYFTEWILHTLKKDNHWFDKLYSIFNMNLGRLFQSYYRDIAVLLELNGLRKALEKEIKGEEEESIANVNQLTSTDTNDLGSDNLQWKSRQIILSLILTLCLESEKQENLLLALSRKIADLIEISFRGSTVRNEDMKLTGLKILNFVLKNYSSMRDPQIPESSILEQQEAQITSALMPAFSKGSSPTVISFAITVAAEVLASNIMPPIKLGRISQLLIDLLGNFKDSTSNIHIGEAVVVTPKAKRKVELAVLDAWAEVVQRSIISSNKELVAFTKKYWSILVPLWIISLREYMMIKYDDNDAKMQMKDQSKENNLIELRSTKIELYEPVWLNFVEALGCTLDLDVDIILGSLNDEELEYFLFILFSQCLEAIVKNIDDYSIKMQVLPALHNVLKSNLCIKSIFEDDIIAEVIGIMDRLISTGDSKEEFLLVDIISDLIIGYSKCNTTPETFLQDIDKLYELLRLLMMIISERLPFIKYNVLNSDEDNHEIKLSATDISLLRKTFIAFESNISNFDNMFKLDLYSCLLFIIGKIYECDDREIVIPIILPLFKALVKALTESEDEKNIALLDIFYGSVKNVIYHKLGLNNKVATILILLSNGYYNLSCQELNDCTEILLEALNNPSTQPIALQGFKRIISDVFKYPFSQYLMKLVIKRFFQDIQENDSLSLANIEIKLIIQFTGETIKQDNSKASLSIALCLSFFAIYHETYMSKVDREIVGEIMALAKLDKNSFREAITEIINPQQKAVISSVMEAYVLSESLGSVEEVFQLKSFN